MGIGSTVGGGGVGTYLSLPDVDVFVCIFLDYLETHVSLELVEELHRMYVCVCVCVCEPLLPPPPLQCDSPSAGWGLL